MEGLTLYLGAVVHCVSATECVLMPNAQLGVTPDGKIAFLRDQKESEIPSGVNVIQLNPNQFLVPGFVDSHIHAPQYPNAGIFGDSTLLDWLDEYTFPMELKFRDREVAEAVCSRLVRRAIDSGTTLASYYGTSHLDTTVQLAKIAQRVGQRCLVGRVCMERFCPEEIADESTESALAADREFVRIVKNLDPHGHNVVPVITPRFAPSCRQKTLCEEGKLAAEADIPVQTHIAENKSEIEWVRELFPDSDHYAGVYDNAGLLGPKTILAHAIHLSEPELQLIGDRKCGISHCPESNASIGSGIAPVRRMMLRGIKCSLGTDISAGSSPSVLRNLKLALLKSRLLSERLNDAESILSVKDGVFLATLGGAQVCGLDKIAGNFTVGKFFDAQLIDVSKEPIDIFKFAEPEDPIERLEYMLTKWVYMGDDRNTVQVWVGGKPVKHSSHDIRLQLEEYCAL